MMPHHPRNLPETSSPPDPSQFAVTAPVGARERRHPGTFVPSLPRPCRKPIRGRAVEDGPLARLDALPDGVAVGATALPLVLVPASLPAGVRYLEGSRSFSLNPSHPAYQHLGEGETETITVDYALLDTDGTRIPSSISWTVTGRERCADCRERSNRRHGRERS